MNDARPSGHDTALPDEDRDARTLVMERVFRAPPERVFRAWTDPAVLATWWGPEGFTTPEHRMDVRPGGEWWTQMMSPDGKPHTVSGVYREIAPPKRLVMTWGWEQPDGRRGHETVVELTFEPAPGGTRLKLVQRLFQSPEDAKGHNAGWASSFRDLDRILA